MTTSLQPLYVGDVKPQNVGLNSLWLSTALEHARIADGPAERAIVISPTLTAEGATCQEPSVWYANGRWHMLYTAGAGGPIAYAYNTSPNPRLGDWTKLGLIYSPGGGAIHSYAYIEGSVGYLYYPNAALSAMSVVTFNANDPTQAWGTATQILTPPFNWSNFGNASVFKANGVYVLLADGTFTGRSWQVGVWTAPAPTGPFTQVSNSLSSLWPAPIANDNPQGGGCFCRFENGKYVLYYHFGRNVGEALPTDIYRATSTDLVTWTVDMGGYPLVSRQLPQECDQIADFHAAQGPNGNWWAFWSAMNNHPSTAGNIICAPMQASLMVYNGSAWDYLLAVPNTVQEPGYIRHSSKTTAYTLTHRDEVPFDTNAGGLTATLPPASIGTYVRIANLTSGATTTNTVTVAKVGSDVLLGPAATAIGIGECHEYHCLRTGTWTRM